MNVTIKDIARMAGVSYSTVSKALNDSPLVKEKTKSKILNIATQLGYQPNFAAQSLVSKKSNTIGVLWPTVERLALSTLATQINSKLEQHSYSMILSINPIDSAIKLFNRFQVDAILLFDEEQPEQNTEVTSSVVPILCYGELGASKFPTITVDRRQAILKAVQYLTNLGHRRISYIGDLSRKINQQEKYIGFMEGIMKYGLLSHPQMATDSLGLSWQAGYQAAKSLLESEYHPTAVISGSYDLTVGIIRAIHEAKLQIPNDISLISYDNIPQMENLEIPVTAVGAPIEKISDSIVESLLTIIEHQNLDAKKSFVESELFERSSCCPPKGF
ncbi:LacI family transcriptional regulator [Fodinisporobacter ferrooxydans]|uniref:LacI family transcriptional regulator n=1 Tax=Fodinisporobacter ferrooxydans TaxID=2901836 RepID=A0ABY4CIT5_9BACL|nr:LacI family transcriptional regulator [Alicyclobacillaceae bacterium MYW30-H2]